MDLNWPYQSCRIRGCADWCRRFFALGQHNNGVCTIRINQVRGETNWNPNAIILGTRKPSPSFFAKDESVFSLLFQICFRIFRDQFQKHLYSSNRNNFYTNPSGWISVFDRCKNQISTISTDRICGLQIWIYDIYSSAYSRAGIFSQK